MFLYQNACLISQKSDNYFFCSLIYFAEKDGLKKWTFKESFWWGLMALTTVGNGEKAPSTLVGKVRLVKQLFTICSILTYPVQSIGCLCALIGVFVLALPVPIVLNR